MMKVLYTTPGFPNNKWSNHRRTLQRKLFILLMLVAGLQTVSLACDICGCGVGSYYIGILPDFKKRFIGLRYQQKGLLAHISPDGSRSYLTTDETYRTIELWGAYNFGTKFRVVGFVPVNQNSRTNGGITNSKTGIGDVAFVGYYNLLKGESTVSNGTKLLVQSLWVGGGLKLPTGAYDATDKAIAQESQNTFQLGTGSVDFTANAMYDLRIQDFGINANASYKMNTANRHAYRYGNKATANLLAYYKIKIVKDVTIAPNAGMLYEAAQHDVKNKNRIVDMSAGHALMGTAGVEVSVKRIGFGMNLQTPLSQHLAGGMVRATNRGMVHVSFGF